MAVVTEFVVAPEPSDPGTLPRLGRLPALDERSHRPRFAMAAPRPTRTFRNWLSPTWQAWPSVLDQGETSECVAFSATKFLLTHPVVNRPRESCNSLYERAQEIDEWPGTDYDGTSVNAGMKVLRNDGLLSAYTWAFESEPVVRHILEIGPVCLGTDWTGDMFNPDKSGYIWPRGPNMGGHAYLLVGVNTKRKNPDETVGAVRILNSWGYNWGQSGRAWMTLGVLQQLLTGLSGWPGEAAAPIEVRLPR